MRALRYAHGDDTVVVAGDDPEPCSAYAGSLAHRDRHVVNPAALHANLAISDFCTIDAATDIVMSSSTYCWWATRVGIQERPSPIESTPPT
ncbi:MAG: hypothetical protein F2789_15430 [Actinobacteria bacterium]|nr:hypothetical protein [Actinomycetota bacterium]